MILGGGMERRETRRGLTAAVVVLTLAVSAADAAAHGGAYYPPHPPTPRGPLVPPGPGGRGPTTGPGGGPTTPGDAATTPGTSTREAAPDLDDWTRWWFANRAQVLRGTDRRDATQRDTTQRDGTTTAEPAWRDEARAALRAALADDDADIASGAAVALGRAADVRAAAALVEALRDPERDVTVREACAIALGLLGRPAGDAAGEALVDTVDDRHATPRLRAIASYALSVGGHANAAELCARDATAEPLRSGDAPRFDLVGAGATGLGISHDAAARELLEGLVARRGASETARRAYAVHGLARLGDASVKPALLRTLRGRDDDARRAACLALGVLATRSDGDAVDALVALLASDAAPSVRGAAAVTLGRLGGGRAVRALRSTLAADAQATPDKLRPFVALALGIAAADTPEEAETATAPMRAILAGTGDASLRGAAACALGLAHRTDARELLERTAAERGDPWLRAHAAFALGLVGDAVDTPQTLREVLVFRGHDAPAREAAAALGRLRDTGSIRALLRVLDAEDMSPEVQGAAAVALGRIGGEEGAGNLTRLLRDTARRPYVRAMAAVALGHALDRQRAAGLAEVAADLDWVHFTDAVNEILTIL